MCIACATASHISLAISRMHYVQSNAQHSRIRVTGLRVDVAACACWVCQLFYLYLRL